MKAVALDMSSLTCSIKTFFGRYIKNYFGKGPEKVTVLFGKHTLNKEIEPIEKGLGFAVKGVFLTFWRKRIPAILPLI